MITLRSGSHAHRLLLVLAVTGEYPMRSLHLLGSSRTLEDTVRRLENVQRFRLPSGADLGSCKMLTTSGRGDRRTIRLYISVDATMTYSLLKMANSCYFAMRHRVTSVRQAIMTMGLNELKQWVFLLSASNAENQMEEGTEEFLRLSFMRASFCSRLMNYAKDMPISKPDAYLMGMLSTLNYLIDAPMEEILSQIPLRDEVKEALLHHSGRSGMLYDLAVCYERADWKHIDELAQGLGIPTNLLTSLYFNCMEEVNRIWSEITSPEPDQIMTPQEEEEK